MTHPFSTETAAKPMIISSVEFDVVWEHLRLGEMPLVLKVPSPGKTYSERRRLVNDTWRSLESRGLGGPVGLDARFEHLVQLLERPQREIDGRLWLGRRAGSVRVLAAATGRSAVLATLTSRGVTLREVSPTGLDRAALAVLPAAPAGPGESVTLPSDDLDAAVANGGPAPRDFAAALRDRGLRARDADTLAAMVTQLRRHGQFGAAVRDRLGQRHRADRVVGFFDNRLGRYLQLRRNSPSGQLWSTFAPADNRQLLASLAELMAEVEDH